MHPTANVVNCRRAPNQAIKVSAQLFTIPLSSGRYIVYAPLRRAAFVANATMVNFLADMDAGTVHPKSDPDGSLVEFLRHLEILDAGPEVIPARTFSGAPQPTAVTLFLTTACNLRCTYCYASAGDTPIKHMPFAVAKRGIEFVIANARALNVPGIEIAYHGGGEPTVNWKTLTQSLHYARRRSAASSIEVKASLATNGVLSDLQIDWILHHIDDISVSFDGLPEVHDRHRRRNTGDGSSSRVAHTLHRLDQADFPYGIRVTVTADQIERLPDSVDYVCREFNPRRVQVEPVYQLGRWCGEPSAETDQFIAAYRHAHQRARSLGREICFSGARLGHLSNHFCGVTQDSFALSPDGNVSACYEAFVESAPNSKVFFYGQPSAAGEGYRLDLAKLNHLRNQSVEHRSFCHGCYAKWSCGGDCYNKALTTNRDREFAGTDRCHIIRELTKDQILDRIAHSGGFFWHERPFDLPNTVIEGATDSSGGNIS